jgi:hypothetical protein
MPKKNKTACKRRKCQRSRSQRRQRNNNRRTRTIRRGGWSWRKTPTLIEAIREANPDGESQAKAAAELRQAKAAAELQSVHNLLHINMSVLRRLIINEYKKILSLLQEQKSYDNANNAKQIKQVQKIISDSEQEDTSLIEQDLPSGTIIDDAKLETDDLIESFQKEQQEWQSNNLSSVADQLAKDIIDPVKRQQMIIGRRDSVDKQKMILERFAGPMSRLSSIAKKKI